MSHEALNHYLLPFKGIMQDEDVTDILINRPGVFWYEKGGVMMPVAGELLTMDMLLGLADLIASYNNDKIDRTDPLLSGHLPTGHRVEIVIPPACEDDKIIFAFRSHKRITLTIEDYVSQGAFENVGNRAFSDDAIKEELTLHKEKHFYEKFFKLAADNKKTILVSGGIRAGKSTFLNMLLNFVDPDTRLVLIENSKEIEPPQKNFARLLYSEGKSQTHSAQDLFRSLVRLRPDLPIIGELRGAEAYAYLNLINSGHPGTITTIHANSPNQALEKVALYVQLASTSMQFSEIMAYIKTLIDIVVQIHYDKSQNRHMITDIELL